MTRHVLLMAHVVGEGGESTLISDPENPMLRQVGEQLGIGPPNGDEGWFWDALVEGDSLV